MQDRTAYLQELKTAAMDGYEHYKQGFKDLEEAYLLILRPELAESLQKRNKSKNYIPKLNSKAKRIYDGLTETYFNNDKFAKLEPYINSSDDVIDKWQAAIDHYAESINLYKTFAPIFLRAPFSASCAVKVYWSKDRAMIDEVSLQDLYFDPGARGLNDISYLVHRIYLSSEDILSYGKRGVFRIENKEAFADKKPYERFEIYEIYELRGGKWYVSSLYENELLRDLIELRDGQPFIVGYMLPQIRCTDEEIYVSAYGEPALASMLPLQNELNVNRNSITDVIRQQVAPKIILSKASMVERGELESVGTPIYADQPSAVQVLPAGDIGGAMAALQVIENEMSEVSGVSPQQNGATTVRKETATMASIMANEGSVRLQGYIRTFNETFFEPIFERLAFLVWKYADPIFFAGFGRGEVPSFKVNLNTGIGALNKEVQKQSLMDAAKMIGAQFGMCLQIGDQAGAAAMKEASKKLLLELLPLYGIKNASEFIGERSGLEGMILPPQIPPDINPMQGGSNAF